MAITEADRNDMHNELNRCHGERLGGIIMEHLPPVGWRDLARQHDITRLEQRLDASDIAHRHDITRLEQRLDGMVHAMWAMGGVMFTGFLGLFTVITVKF